MPNQWWDSIMDLIPDHLVQSHKLAPFIDSLHDEILNDYDKSIRKSMGRMIFCHTRWLALFFILFTRKKFYSKPSVGV